jgi:deazaflavin-dependent oxidoreductase (nitroreductase family)
VFHCFGRGRSTDNRETDGEEGHDWTGHHGVAAHHHGRDSGATRTMPLIYQRHGDDYIVVASNGGGDPPGWFLNLQERAPAKVRWLARAARGWFGAARAAPEATKVASPPRGSMSRECKVNEVARVNRLIPIAFVCGAGDAQTVCEVAQPRLQARGVDSAGREGGGWAKRPCAEGALDTYVLDPVARAGGRRRSVGTVRMPTSSPTLGARAAVPDDRRHPHVLRHTFDLCYLRASPRPKALEEMRRLLGHADLATTRSTFA